MTRSFWQIILVSIMALSACVSGNDIEPVTDGDWYRPAVGATWQWQLSGKVNQQYQVDIYDIDLFDSSADLIYDIQSSGSKVICYFSAGSYEGWRDDAKDFKAAELGNALDGYENERWLDIRSSNVLSIMTRRMDLAVEKGCDGVEPDNMDGYTNNPGFKLSAKDQLAFNRNIANAAHARGLSVGLKNDLDQVSDLIDYYDFAVNEQCFEYEECDTLTPFIKAGKAVFHTEYKEEYLQNEGNKKAICDQARALSFSTLLLPVELDDSFRFSCSP
ncbi:endo alpha-1,4 polygalactosaminidase [Leucothrix pacifica]|uniref:Endo alpha-1,4 polygalactosaminidase n=2 Tax=Leucothrix pacifica TaxID=1247513 RepID=A0A317C271_9GAMM|nr:endo alpha-1,4 polygalactosaminidase [Leucothrix pacifica]